MVNFSLQYSDTFLKISQKLRMPPKNHFQIQKLEQKSSRTISVVLKTHTATYVNTTQMYPYHMYLFHSLNLLNQRFLIPMNFSFHKTKCNRENRQNPIRKHIILGSVRSAVTRYLQKTKIMKNEKTWFFMIFQPCAVFTVFKISHDLRGDTICHAHFWQLEHKSYLETFIIFLIHVGCVRKSPRG